MITEIQMGRGQVEVRLADSERWRPATPLLALKAGDTVATTGDAWVVIVLSGARGTVRVDEVTSPYLVTAPALGRGRLHKGWAILEASFDYLSGTGRERPLGVVGTRAAMGPPVILTPHNGLVLPDSLVFEWRGSQSSMYGVRVIGPDGLVLERGRLAGNRFQYPESAPPLTAGVRYRFQLLAPWQPPQEVWFEVVEPELARQVRHDLRDLDEALAPGLPPATLATLRAGFLARSGLLHDARLALAEELARRPDEPTLHFLLGDLYARQGLSREATEAFAEARFLMSGAVSR
ncbi:MAG TPA: hypothetical protein VIG07_17085 [Methylomirabilota bacterium]|jgi:hypothetical protein